MFDETYLNLIDAVQARVVDKMGEGMMARDWILICGVDNPSATEDGVTRITIDKSARLTAYAANGLMNYSIDMFHPYDEEQN